jgi:hypothetical protein
MNDNSILEEKSDNKSYFSTIKIRRIKLTNDYIQTKEMDIILKKKYKSRDDTIYLKPRIEFKQWCLKQFPDITQNESLNDEFKQSIITALFNDEKIARPFLSLNILEHFGYIFNIDYNCTIQILHNNNKPKTQWLIRRSQFSQYNTILVPNIDVIVIARVCDEVIQYRFINIQGIGWYNFTKQLEYKLYAKLSKISENKREKSFVKQIIWDDTETFQLPEFVCIYDLLQYFVKTYDCKIEFLMKKDDKDILEHQKQY